jgi:hypothetical protein
MNFIRDIINSLRNRYVQCSICELDIDYTQAPKEIEKKIREFYKKKWKGKYKGKELKKKLDEVVYRIMNKKGLL